MIGFANLSKRLNQISVRHLNARFQDARLLIQQKSPTQLCWAFLLNKKSATQGIGL
jgi:hypothetical protein